MSETESEDLSEGLPTGTWSNPVREASNGAEPFTDEMKERMDEISDQNLGEVGAGFDRRTPRRATVAESNQPRPPSAKLQGEDEGPLGSGGQLRGPDAGGGGSS
jgi:hypothetical protein